MKKNGWGVFIRVQVERGIILFVGSFVNRRLERSIHVKLPRIWNLKCDFWRVEEKFVIAGKYPKLMRAVFLLL